MPSLLNHLSAPIPLMAGLAGTTLCQQVLTWQQVKDNFESANPSLQAGRSGIDESRAAEIAAHAQVDLDRLELQPVQYESDLQIAEESLETAKIPLSMLLNDRTPVDQFDISGPFDFSRQIAPLDEVRHTALEARPDLKAALQSVDKAKTDHSLAIANGSTDPTFGFDAGRNPTIDQYVGLSVNIPLRIFDRNQGEKKRTELDIERNEKLMQVIPAQVFSDVDSAYATVTSVAKLLQPYQDRYLQQAARVCDTIAFSYEHSAAFLLDSLNAQADYRSVQTNYLNLVASYLDAANQLNLAVGREVLQ
jgi:outer membrane protein, heavy metal efflux system